MEHNNSQTVWTRRRIKGLRKIANDIQIQAGELLTQGAVFHELDRARLLVLSVSEQIKGN